MNNFQFKILHLDKKSQARVGELKTPHGTVSTPRFIPVGTQATVKSLTPQDLREIGVEIILANTYHLHLRPGEDTVARFGELGKFMAWDGPTMTDSGGYQVFSLGQAHTGDKEKLSKFSKSVFLHDNESRSFPHVVGDARETSKEDQGSSRLLSESRYPSNNENEVESGPTFSSSTSGQAALLKTSRIRPAKIDSDGVTFYSHLDGTEHRVTPEISIAIQEKLGADLIVAFDDHESPIWDYEITKLSLERTNKWVLRSKAAQKRKDQLLYGIVHGGMYEDLRRGSAEFINSHFEAIAIGGSYTSKEVLYNAISWCVPYFDTDKPRHLLGIGEVQDILEGVSRGMDLFDCVAPTRRARHGSVYISPQNGGAAKQNFVIQISNNQYALDNQPLDPGCQCYSCVNFTRGYVNHLFRAQELLAYRLATYHNLYFINNLVKQIREAIANGQFDKLKSKWL